MAAVGTGAVAREHHPHRHPDRAGDPSNNGGTEAINGLIELHRRVARGFRNYDNYRLRMLLIGGGLAHPHLK